MDFLPDKEFHRIFNRVSQIVDLKGAGTPQEINKRLNQKIKQYKFIPRKYTFELFKGRGWIPFLKQLIFAGFGRRTIDEAYAKPYEIVSLTLRYGREKARFVLLERTRRQLDSLRKRKWKRKAR